MIQACERYCNLGDAGISGDAQLLKEFTAHINQWGRKVWHMIFMAYGGWQYDDGNQLDLPAATTDLTANQTSIALPSSSLSVRGIEVKDTAGIWHALIAATEEQIREFQAMGEFHKTSGQPQYYQIVGQTVRLFPAADYTQSASFKVFFDRGSVAFSSDATSSTPGFVSEYHDILGIGASIEWLKIKQPTSGTLAILRGDLVEYELKLKAYYSMKFSQMFPPRLHVRDVMRDAV